MVVDIIGLMGLLIILGFYLGGIFKKVNPEDPNYLFMNAIGAAFLIAYDLMIGPTLFIILQVVWFVSSMYRFLRST